MHSTSPTVAFVLSGGASLGAIQVGMLHALYAAFFALALGAFLALLVSGAYH